MGFDEKSAAEAIADRPQHNFVFMDGTLIEEADDLGLGNVGPEDAFKFLKSLHDGARRSAMGVDKALDSLLSALSQFGDKPPQSPTEDDVPF